MSAQEAADDLVRRIRAGEFKPAGKLPTITQLADHYKMSRSSAQRVILILRVRGEVVGIQGKGIYVRD